jgi:hypothetical protein
VRARRLGRTGTAAGRDVKHTVTGLDANELDEALPKVSERTLRIELGGHSIESRGRSRRQGSIVTHRVHSPHRDW